MKLAIVIPTFNRPRELAAILAQICEQQQKISDDSKIRVYISDNCSPQEEEIRDAVDKCLTFGVIVNYSRNNTNIGPDANFILSLSLPEDEDFVWFLGDDDELLEDALDTVIQVLDQERPTYLAFSFLMDGAKRPGLGSEALRFHSFAAYIQKTLWHSTFISISVFDGLALKRALRAERVTNFIGGFEIQLHVILEVCSQASSPNIVLSNRAILNQKRVNYADWDIIGPGILYGIGRFSRELNRLSGEQKTSRMMLAPAVKRLVVELLNEKAKGKFSFGNVPLLLYTYGSFPGAIISVFVAMLIPRFVVTSLRKLIFALGSSQKLLRNWLQSV